MSRFGELRKISVTGTGSNILDVGAYTTVRIQVTDTTSLAFTPKGSVSSEDYENILGSQVLADGDSISFDVSGYNYLDVNVTAGTGSLAVSGSANSGSSPGIGSMADAPVTDPAADASLISVAKGLLPVGPVEPTIVTLTTSGQDIVPSLAGAGLRWYGTIQWQSTSLDDETTLEWSNDGGTTWHRVMMVKGFAVSIAHSDTNSKVQVRYNTSKTASGAIKAIGYFELTGV